MCNRELIGFSRSLIKNGKVVVYGSLTSLEGQIIRVDHRKGRAKVQLNFIREPHIGELDVPVIIPFN